MFNTIRKMSSAGGFHNIALTKQSLVIVWGRNEVGQSNVPAFSSGVQRIASGDNHNLAILNDGSVVAWGYNAWGQVSNIPLLEGCPTHVSAGVRHSIVLIPTTGPLRSF